MATTGDVVQRLKSRPHLLSAPQVADLVAELDAQLAAATEPRTATVAPPTQPIQSVLIEPPRRRRGLSLVARLGLSAAMLAVLVGVPVLAAAVLRASA